MEFAHNGALISVGDFEVLTAVTVMTTVLWDGTAHSLVDTKVPATREDLLPPSSGQKAFLIRIWLLP